MRSPYAGAIARLAPGENPALIEAWMRLEYLARAYGLKQSPNRDPRA